MIAYDSLREYIHMIDALGQAKTIRGADWRLELACINELVAEQKGPLLIFDEIASYPRGYRVVTNLLTTHERLCLALGIPAETPPLKIIEGWKNRLREVEPLAPIVVDDAAIRRNVRTDGDVDVFAFPTPHWHPRDGGRYVGTGALVVTRDPDEGWINCAINRCMLVSRNQVSLQMGSAGQNATIASKYAARNEPCPVAICMSPDPLLMLIGGTKVPWGVSEYDFCGGLRGRRMTLTSAPTTGLPVPVSSEIVFDGFIAPGASCDEGPYGEWTGYIAGTYKKADGFVRLVDVRAILHDDDPVLLGIRFLKPPTNGYTSVPLTNASAIWSQLEGGGQRGVKGVWTHVLESFGAVWTVVAIEQLYKGHAKEVGVAASVCPGANGWGAYFVVVDHDIDITSLSEVLWAVATRCDMGMDIIHYDGTRVSALYPWIETPGGSGAHTGGRMIFDACKAFERRHAYPPANVFDRAYKEEIAKKWNLQMARAHSRTREA